MQPTLAITAPAAGLLYLNGRLLGEADPETPLLAPVRPFGAIYLEYRPLTSAYHSLAGKLVFSGGKPMPDSLAASGGMFAVHWPCGVTETELSPERRYSETTEEFRIGEHPCRIRRGKDSLLETGSLTCRFPQDGSIPEVHRRESCTALTGTTPDGHYIIALSGDLTRMTGFIQADKIEFESESVIRALLLRHDFAGHATAERWMLSDNGLIRISAEPAWEHGSPRLPETPEEAVRYAIDAIICGTRAEADTYLSPTLQHSPILQRLQADCPLCLSMKYPASDGCSCIGLFKPESAGCAAVHPLFYRTAQNNNRHLVTYLSLQPPAPQK